ncbi:MAG: type I pullulanase, partial [Muribaculaceae bacterium]|nr:type I pullulanase [Muribaculaceae bacterium]
MIALNSSANAMTDEKYLNYPTYTGDDLELVVTPEATRFALWSPDAEAVRVNLYNTDRNTPAYKTIEMSKGENGVWRASVPEPLYGKFYTFNVKTNGKWLNETPGIWAKAVGTNGQRAAIIDFAKTNPDGWAEDHGPELKSITDAVIYEMHHRDFSVHPSSGIVNKGKFLALTEPMTKSSDGLATGIEHLKELGVTHVHILPS